MNYKEVLLTGSPYEKGVIHGTNCKKEVLNSLQNYRQLFLDRKGLSWDKAKSFASAFIPYFQGENTAYLEEMQGIADASNLELEDILALNIRTEILCTGLTGKKYTANTLKQSDFGCTAFSFISNPTNQEKKVLAGQSWDYASCQRDSFFICRIPASGNAPSIIMFMEGGIIGGKGINSSGICLTLNALYTQGASIGLPLHVRMRKVLESLTLETAYEHAITSPIPCSANLILTSKEGLSLDLELDPGGVDILMPDMNGFIVHTNHFCSSKLSMTHEHRQKASTYIRYQRMCQLIRNNPEITLSTLESFFKDHVGFPVSICTHPSPILPSAKKKYATTTNYAFIADLSNDLLRFSFGNPCETGFESIKMF